ncbi:MAG: DUF4433 domain-containing protein [Burkholderiales bacterium]|nr:DUF4433 domain-containing protein [Burkholderiales bacterium]
MTQPASAGVAQIKQRRLTSCLNSYPDLRVGDCVPFYFCPRSVCSGQVISDTSIGFCAAIFRS